MSGAVPSGVPHRRPSRSASLARLCFGLLLATLCCRGIVRSFSWFTGERAPVLSQCHRSSSRSKTCVSASEEGKDAQDTSTADSDLLDAARAAAEASKLRLEAEKLRSELETNRKVATEVTPTPTTAPVAPQVATQTSTGSSSEASALLNSEVVRRATRVALALRRADGGEQALEELVLSACSALEKGGDVRQVVGSESQALEKAGVDPEEARQAFEALAELLTPRGNVDNELKRGPQAARAAVLKLMVFDQLPDKYSSYAKLTSVPEQSEEREMVFMDPEVSGIGKEAMEGARFAGRLELIGDDSDRVRERFQRLAKMPLAQEVKSLAAQDAELSELSEALKPWQLRLYNATRTAQLRLRPEKPPDLQVLTIDFSIEQLIGGFVVFVALIALLCAAGGAFNPQSSSDYPSQVPLYSLGRQGQ
mmetsp:Transcript_37714/g.82863  ORF Transcript_37714/g.82863 Transcript_37714/m.82863 type:complete len:423 (-) Transcript_37714:146-1414(-)